MTHSTRVLITSMVITLSLCACASQRKRFELAPAGIAYLRQPARVSGHPTLAFEANFGQADAETKFLWRARRIAALLVPTGAVLTLSGADAITGNQRRPRTVIRMRLMTANEVSEIVGIQQTPGRSHYFTGGDPAKWHTNIPNYTAVAYRSVYRGVDLVFHGSLGELEYDFVVAAGADPRKIEFAFEGADQVRLDKNHNLVVETAVGEIVHRAPACYQQIDGARREVSGRCAFRLDASSHVGFDVSGYDVSRPLVIDPTLVYSTYMGGSGHDGANAAAADADGNLYVTGETASIDFPATAGVLQPESLGSSDIFVTKLDPGGTVVYSTYIGGGNADRGNSIVVDSAGNAYVTGRTGSTDFPTTPAAFRRFCGCDLYDAFVSKLNPDGAVLLYSTFLGGGANESGFAIAVDDAGTAFVAGGTNSSDFPTTEGAFQTTYGGGVPGNDAWVTKLDADGRTLQYSTYLGGSFVDRATGIAIDLEGSAYVTGWTESTDFPVMNPQQATKSGGRDAFVTKVQPDGRGLVFSTFLGGSGEDGGLAIAVDSSASPHITGYTESLDFPTRNAYQAGNGGGRDAFVTKLDAAGTDFVYSTYLGGSSNENLVGTAALVGAIAVDAEGRPHVTGSTSSADFPIVSPAQSDYGGGLDDAFAAKFDAAGQALVYSTFLGGSLSDVGIDVISHASGDTYIVGQTASTDFPIVNAVQPTSGGGTEAFVSRITDAVPTTAADLAVTTTALPDPVMPDADITYLIELTNHGPNAGISATLSDEVPAGTTLQSLAASMGWSCDAPDAGGTGTVLCANPSVAAGSMHSFTLVVRADAALPDGTVISNTAVAASSTSDPESGNNSTTVTTTVSAEPLRADLRIAMADSPDPVAPSSNIDYTIEISNGGPTLATAIELTIEVAADSTFESVSGPEGLSCITPAVGESGLVSCTISSLESEVTEILTLVVRVRDSVENGTLIASTASVSSAVADPDVGNNAATVTTTISIPEAMGTKLGRFQIH